MGTHKRVLDFHVTGTGASYDNASVYPATTGLLSGSVVATAVDWTSATLPPGVTNYAGTIAPGPYAAGDLAGIPAISFHTLWNNGFGLAWRKGQPIFGKFVTSIASASAVGETAQVEVLNLPTAT